MSCLGRFRDESSALHPLIELKKTEMLAIRFRYRALVKQSLGDISPFRSLTLEFAWGDQLPACVEDVSDGADDGARCEDGENADEDLGEISVNRHDVLRSVDRERR